MIRSIAGAFALATFITAIVAIASIAESTAAQARPNTSRMTCAAARSLVTQQGAIVLDTSSSRFDRYVSSHAYCHSDQITEPAFVPTADDRQCFVGHTCREIYGDR
jgi:hypothetical protein